MVETINNKAIKVARQNRGLTQVEFCKQFGITQGFLSKIENGIKECPYSLLVKVKNEFNLPMKFFLTEEDEDCRRQEDTLKILLNPAEFKEAVAYIEHQYACFGTDAEEIVDNMYIELIKAKKEVRALEKKVNKLKKRIKKLK